MPQSVRAPQPQESTPLRLSLQSCLFWTLHTNGVTWAFVTGIFHLVRLQNTVFIVVKTAGTPFS